MRTTSLLTLRVYPLDITLDLALDYLRKYLSIFWFPQLAAYSSAQFLSGLSCLG